MKSLFNPRAFALGAAVLSLAAAGLTGTTAPATAQQPEYAGKTLNVIVRSSPGGGNDFYCRLIARHIGKYIDGAPNTIVTNMPGGGGLVAANYMANRAKRDGTEIALLGRDLVVVQRLGATGVRYDARKLISIGNIADDTYVWVTKSDSPVKTMADLRDYDGTMKFGGTGAGTASVQSIGLLKADGFNVQPITGYTGTSDRLLAMARGDVDAMSGSYGSLRDAIRDENLIILARIGNHPDTRDVPNLRTLISEERRAVASLMSAPMEMSRPMYTTPEVPANRVKILRDAIKATLEDKTFQDEANRAKRDINWTSAEEIEKLTEEILSASDAVVDEFKAL